MKPTIDIKIASDVVCPWCYLGKQNLEVALDQLKNQFNFEVQYLPFELAPYMPEEGMSFKEHITGKFGNWDRFIENSAALFQKGKAAGITLRIPEIQKTPNTFSIHRVIQFAHQYGIQAKVKEAYFKAYFDQLIDLTLIQNIVQVAVDAGLKLSEVEYLLNSEEGVKELRTLEEDIITMGITGVPFFIINNKYGISGAVPPEHLVDAIIQSAEEMQQEKVG